MKLLLLLRQIPGTRSAAWSENSYAMKTKDATNKDIQNDPKAQGPMKGQTQGDRDRQNGTASTLKKEIARRSKEGHSVNSAGRGRRGTSDNVDQ